MASLKKCETCALCANSPLIVWFCFFPLLLMRSASAQMSHEFRLPLPQSVTDDMRFPRTALPIQLEQSLPVNLSETETTCPPETEHQLVVSLCWSLDPIPPPSGFCHVGLVEFCFDKGASRESDLLGNVFSRQECRMGGARFLALSQVPVRASCLLQRRLLCRNQTLCQLCVTFTKFF